MQNNLYKETLDWLFNQFPAYHKIGVSAYKPSLDNCIRLAEYFQNPQNDLKFIHIAGTNGKGSTSSMLASILTESKEIVGLFTSPHIEDFRERIRVNGEMITEDFVIEFCEKVKSLRIDFEPSFFEITWVLALVYFRSKKTTVCVIEAGLGGRLDATNIITPLLSIITNIGLEHTNFLGDTLELIATEKAGIIKSTVPVVIGESVEETKNVFNKIANQNSTTIYFAEDFNYLPSSNFPLLGEYQKINYNTIRVAIDVLNEKSLTIESSDIEVGLKNIFKNTGFRGRMQVMSYEPLLIFDVSHNYDGIKATLNSISNTSGQLLIVYGTSADKDLESIFSLFPKNAKCFFTEFKNERSAKISQLENESIKNGLEASFYLESKLALQHAKDVAGKEDTILVFGSFFLLSDFF